MKQTYSLVVALLIGSLLFFSSARAMDEKDLAEIQKAIEANGARWTAGDNPIFRLSKEEQRRLCGDILESSGSSQASAWMYTTPRKDLPEALDWRNFDGANYVTPIRDQAGCGSCVAFGTLASFEGRIQITRNRPGSDLDLSEQHIFSCGGGYCDYGWGTNESHDYLLNEGAPLEKCLPYEAIDVDCPTVTCSDWQDQARKISAWGEVPSLAVNDIKTALMDGPVACSFTVYDDFFSYHGGIYQYVSGEVAGGHCVSIIGWSDADSCWICKNSWGPGWGEDGFFRIRMAHNEVGIEENVKWLIPQQPQAYAVIEQYTIMDQVSGNGDGVPDPGETFQFTVTLSNPQTYALLTDISGWLLSTDPRVIPMGLMAAFPDLPDGGTCNNDQTPFSIKLAPHIGITPILFTMYINGTCDYSIPYLREVTLEMPITVDHPGWPVSTASGVRCSPLMVWNGSGPRSLVSTEDGGSLHLWNDSGQDHPGFPFSAPGGTIWGSVAMGDLDGDGQDDIVFGSKNDTLYALHRDGSLLFKRSVGADILATPAIADLNSDGSPEIAVGTMGSEIHVLTAQGEKYGPFPIVLSGPIMADAALADLDQDGCLDVLVGSQDGKFHAICTQTGQSLDGFPVTTGGAIWAGPVVADLNGDGARDVIFGSDDKKLYVVDPSGTIVYTYATKGAIRSSPAVADLNANSHLDVVFTSQDGKIYVLTHLGYVMSGWPYNTEKVLWSSPIVLDIDDDGSLEVVVEVPGASLLHLEANGSTLMSLAIPSSGIPMSSPVAGDLDNDGDLEIAVGSTDGVYVFDYSTPSTVQIPWPMYRGCAQRTGFIDDILTGSSQSPTTPAVPAGYALYQNYPNPFNPETVIRYSLAEDVIAHLTIYNVLGQEVIALVDGQKTAGAQQATWNGRDASGKSVSAGLYFYRLQAGDYSETRKMVLLK